MLINLQFRMAYFEKVQIALNMPIRLMGSANLFIPGKKSLIFISQFFIHADSIVCIRCSSVEYGSVFFGNTWFQPFELLTLARQKPYSHFNC